MRDQMIKRRAILKGVVAAPVLFGAVSISLTETAYAYDWPRTLSQGSSGSDVKELQIRVARGPPPLTHGHLPSDSARSRLCARSKRTPLAD
jgi:hypothetical protein